MILLRPRRRFFASACAVLGIALSMPLTAMALQPAVRIVHLDARQMSSADQATLRAHHTEIIEAAEIYGYNLVAGNWTYRQTICAPLPNTILLHYSQRFPDGTESLFTALVPRGKGQVRIVPVLHRSATPFVPAPRNPRNYALFNRLVPKAISTQGLVSSRNWIELSACYAEMTGASIEIPKGGSVEAGVAGAPTATIHLDSQHKSSLVTFADRESERTFRVWSISLNHLGRVTAAGTEDYPVNPSQMDFSPAPVVAQAPATRSVPVPAGLPANASIPAARPVQPQPGVPMQPAKANTVASSATLAAIVPSRKSPAKAVAQTSRSETSGPGWKFIPEAPQPPSKIIPQAPEPPSKVVAQAPDK
ncbi:MAG TPA: hypothetical protein VMU92_04910 [Acidobacteriaceae bacterium]|nr:hypothetical protein [Acidobacteriaceae bacterium]